MNTIFMSHLFFSLLPRTFCFYSSLILHLNSLLTPLLSSLSTIFFSPAVPLTTTPFFSSFSSTLYSKPLVFSIKSSPISIGSCILFQCSLSSRSPSAELEKKPPTQASEKASCSPFEHFLSL